jgi:hypothetical protein
VSVFVRVTAPAGVGVLVGSPHTACVTVAEYWYEAKVPRTTGVSSHAPFMSMGVLAPAQSELEKRLSAGSLQVAVGDPQVHGPLQVRVSAIFEPILWAAAYPTGHGDEPDWKMQLDRAPVVAVHTSPAEQPVVADVAASEQTYTGVVLGGGREVMVDPVQDPPVAIGVLTT